mgnify:CR=1 FL=1
MHVVVVIAALLLLLPGVAAAGEFEELVLLRGDVSFDLVDGRDSKRVSDAFVDDVLMGAANELGLFLRPGAPAPDHIKLTIDELACTEAGCRVQLDGVLVSPTGSEPFAVDESTRDGIAALEPLVQEALLLELSALTSVAAALERTPTESPKTLRYGWLTRADGTRVHGAVAEDPGGGVCVVRDGSATPVAMEDLAEVDVRDVHLLGAKPGMDWAVTRFDGARIVGGTVVERPRDADTVWIRTRQGVYGVPADREGLTRGRWTAAPLACTDEVAAAPPPPPRRTEPEPRDRWRPVKDTGEVVLVDRSGGVVEPGAEYWDTRLYALDRARVGVRKWKRYRLTWKQFADRTGDSTVELAIEDYVDRHERIAQTNKALIGVGVGTAVTSGVIVGILSSLLFANTNVASTDAYWVGLGAAGGGIGTGVALALGGQVGVFLAGRKMRGPTRYEDLLMILSAEEAERAAARTRGRNGGGEGFDRD